MLTVAKEKLLTVKCEKLVTVAEKTLLTVSEERVFTLPHEKVLDILTLRPMIFFMLTETDYLDSATIELTSESGKLVFQSDERWDVKFSEKNEVLYMTITDSDGKTVYYQQK